MKNKKNVLHLVEYLYLGGIERLLEQIAQGSKDQANLFFYTYETNSLTGMGKIIAEQGFPVFYSKKNPGQDLNLVKRLNRVIKENKIEVIHTHDFGPMFYAVCLKILNPKIKLVHTQHTPHHFLSNKKYKLFFQFASYFYYKINCVSTYVKEQIRKQCPLTAPFKLIVNSNGVDLTLFKKKQLTYSQNKLIFTNVARLSAEKNLIYVLKTCQLLKNAGIDFEFHHAGAGTDTFTDYIKNKIVEYGIKDEVYLHGMQKDVRPILDKSDIFVTPSLTEGHPVALLEAMACEKICLCSDIPQHREISNSSLIFFDLNQEDSLFNILKELKINNEELKRKTELARVEVEQRFSLNAMVARYIGQYNKRTRLI